MIAEQINPSPLIRLQQVASDCSAGAGAAVYLSGDLREQSFLDEAVAQATADLGHVDVLFNNAGTSHHEPVYDVDVDAWRSVLEVNFSAAVHLSRQLLPGMIERKRGAIVNISSINGRHTNAGNAIYAATKHALNGFTGCLYDDVREFGIKVSTIMPGFTNTTLTSDIGHRQRSR